MSTTNLLPVSILERTCKIIQRQSTLEQKENNRGSGLLQLGLTELGESFGFPASSIEVVDLSGESSTHDKDRPGFDQLVAEVAAGLVGMVIVGRGDRIGRNFVDSAAFLKAAADTKTLICVSGRLYDPSAVNDRMVLGMLAQLAQYENDARVLWMVASRWTLAKHMQFRILLPTGLVWADPQDPEYRRQLQREGLAGWLDRSDEHLEAAHHEGRTLRIMPYPDAEVIRACELTIAWVLELGDLSAVVQRITGPTAAELGWPRPGAIPLRASRKHRSEQRMTWFSGTPRAIRARLRDWLRVPAVFGIYRYNSPALQESAAAGTEVVSTFSQCDAFPGFAPSAEFDTVGEILQGINQGWKQGGYSGPRPHALKHLHCGVSLADGTVCGRRLTAMYTPDRYAYYSQGCSDRGHPVPAIRGRLADKEVIAIILETLDTESVRQTVSSIRLRSNGIAEGAAVIQAQIEKLQERVKAVRELEVQAQLDKDTDDLLTWRKHRHEKESELRRLEKRYSVEVQEENQLRMMSQADLARVSELASTLPELLERARAADPKILRRILSALVKRVLFVRQNAYAVTFAVEFPSGLVVTKVVRTRNFNCSQAALAWVAGRVGEGVESEIIAAELNWAPATKHRVRWDAERVEIARWVADEDGLGERRTGTYRSAAELASTYDVAHKAVLVAAFSDSLGPAEFRVGDLWLCPTESELHRAIPEAARLDVAMAAGWPVADTISLAEAMELSGQIRATVNRRARNGSGIVKDALGRDYGRRRELLMTAEEAIRQKLAAEAPALLDLHPDGWRPMTDALKLFPGRRHDQIEQDHPIVRPGIGYMATRSCYVWLDPKRWPLTS